MVFAGRATARREALLAQLVEFGLAPWGPGWRRTSLRDCCRGERMVMDDFLRAYGGASVAVNIHHTAEGVLAGRDVGCNRRLLELAAIGAAQVVDDRGDLHACFTPGEEVRTFRSAQKLRAYVEELLHDLPAAEALGGGPAPPGDAGAHLHAPAAAPGPYGRVRLVSSPSDGPVA
ncbi:MAG: glycosyltransferase family protein [Gemmatimonadales bacterium]